MKKQLALYLSVLSIALFTTNCGRWSDNIKLSTKSAIFKSSGDSIIVTTKGDWWWLTDIDVDANRFYDYGDIDTFADSFIVKRDFFIFERRDKNTIFIKMDPNPTGVKRKVIFHLEAGDYFNMITIIQNSE